MNPIKVGVIGVGRLGAFHVQKYRLLEGCDLVAVADIDEKRARKIAKPVGVPYLTDYRELFDKVEAVSIATPTSTHFEVGKEFLKRGIHALIEKPLCATPNQAQELIETAQENGAKLQVGHVERFNPAILRADPLIRRPLFIEVHRLGNFSKRGTDVDVVLDLMIHDLDLVIHYVDSPVTHISAAGVPVLTPQGDIANVRLEFESGCVANLTASRVSKEKTRKFRLFQQNGYLSIDLLNHEVTWVKKVNRKVLGHPIILPRKLKVSPKDALEEELSSFLNAVAGKIPVQVTGEDGYRALAMATTIKEEMMKRLDRFADAVT
jgi:predicted dehydrogenase